MGQSQVVFQRHTTMVDINQAGEFFSRFFRLSGGAAKSIFAKLMCDDQFMTDVLKFAETRMNANPFEQSVDEQIIALRAQNIAGNWGISEEKLQELANTAPAWPTGKEAYRSFRIRFGEKRDGVINTFEKHIAAIKRVHDPKFWRWELLLSGEHPYQNKKVDRLRLLNGNDSHHATVEWVIINDLSANRKRNSITAVRGQKSLADEGLVLAWLFPKRVQAIDYKELPAWYCAGYENNVPGLGGEPWGRVTIVNRNSGTGGAGVHAYWRSSTDSDSSVPSFE